MSKPLRAPIPDLTPDTSQPPPNPFNLFPSEIQDFDSDPRISYSRADAKWLLETDSGLEFEYIEPLKRWVPTVRTVLLSHITQELSKSVGNQHANIQKRNCPTGRALF